MEEKVIELDEAQQKEIEKVVEMTADLIWKNLTELLEIARILEEKEIVYEMKHKQTGKAYRCKFSYEEIKSEDGKDEE